MKKVLFATTALVASTSFAMADGHISMSASAKAGIAKSSSTAAATQNDGDLHVYNQAAITFTLSGASDNGLEFGSSISGDVGNDFDTGDFEFDGPEDGLLGGGSVWISSGGFTITFANDDIDDLHDDDNTHDMSISYSAGDLTFDMTHDIDDGAADSQSSYAIGYSAGDLTIGVNGNDGDTAADGGVEVTLGYALGDISLGLSHDMPAVGDSVTELSASFSAGGADISVSADTADAWDISVGIDVGGVALSMSTDESDNWEVTATMDAGGGLSLHAGADGANDAMFLGAAMTF